MTVLAECEALSQVNSRAEYVACLERAAGKIGCATFGGFYFLEKAAGGQASDWHSFNNVPSGYGRYYDPEASRLDPAIRHVRLSSLPLIWTQQTYVDAGVGQLWEEQAAWGLRSGLCLGLHLPAGKHFALGFETTEVWSAGDARAHQVLADFSLISVFAQAAAARIFAVPDSRGSGSKLSMREVEVLRWTAAGKTNWEISIILSISASTVAKHIESATRKLGCVNKPHAVAEAMRAGLL